MSPVAEGLLRWRVECLEAQPRLWRIESAGTWAPYGLRAWAEAREAMRQRGISIDEHRTRPVTPNLLRQFHLVLTMDDLQKRSLEIEYPDCASRMYRLTEMSGQRIDLAAPRAPDVPECERICQELSMWLTMGDERIHQLARLDVRLDERQVI